MIVKKIKNIIVFNLSLVTALIAIFVGISIFIFNLNNIALKKIVTINLQINQINVENKKNNNRLLNIIKYEKKWSQLPDKYKSTQIIRSNQVNQIISKVSQKYHIKDVSFTMDVPSKLSTSKFKKDSVEVYLTSGNMSFEASDDVKAMSFIKDFFSTLPGNIVIENISLTKPSNYSNNDYVAISKNGYLSKIRARVKFYWYSNKDKN